MNTIIKTLLTVACIVALAWPLLFWRKPAPPEKGSQYRHVMVRSMPFVFTPHDDFVW